MCNNLISIVVPVYNVENYLDRCIRSIVEQTYKNIEIILVDDGATDHSSTMCDEWKKMDNRINVVHKKNGGLSDARNAGLKIATGDLVAFVDSDDWISKYFLEYLYQAMIDTGCDIVECNRLIVCDEDFLYENNPLELNQTYDVATSMKLLIEDSTFHQTVWNKLYKKDVINNVLFEVGKTNEDEFWTYQVFGNAKSITKINNHLYFYFQRNTSIMGNYSIRRLDAIEAKLQRQDYISKNFEDLDYFSKYNLYTSCIYQGQMILKNLKKSERQEAIAKLNDYLSRCDYHFKDLKKVNLKKFWITLSLFSFWGVCHLKNFLHRI